ncbi:MAG: DUF3365 domain-containing protein [Eggerthellaceae bacterium]|nr:DUF3365 domain-containing protein [Eggerthellaceae bacterium]
MGKGVNTFVSRIGLRTKIIVLFVMVLLTLMAAFSIFTYYQQLNRMESEVLDRARTLDQEMMATWDFVSLNQNIINYDSSGAFDYKGLHCALAGKSVAVLFSKRSDDTIRFTKLEPRNIYNRPDEFETQALETFSQDKSVQEYYEFTDYDGQPVFRYLSVMKVTKDCIECHGHPKGEIDITGYPKEGWSIGDNGGAISIVIPTDLYFSNMKKAILENVTFFGLVLLALIGVIVFAISKMVTQPLDDLGLNLRRVNQDPTDAIQMSHTKPAYRTRETEELFTRFNNMSQALSGLYRDLEGQVEDRTQQLAHANEELEAQRAHVEHVNEQLKQENQYKSDFLAIVSHELRTPLTSILAFTDLMSTSIPEGDTKARRQLDEVEKNGQTLLEMVNNILETARIQAGSEKINLEVVDLGDIVNMVEETNNALAEKKGIRFSTYIDPDLPLITSDWEKVRRILVNLVSNAIKFTDAGGFVELRAEKRGDAWVSLSVRDNGIGIPADKQELIFERFTQENMSTQRRYGGSGLGLSLVRELAEMLGGSVRLESSPGEGSTFEVVLPVECPEPAPAASGADDAQSEEQGEMHGD